MVCHSTAAQLSAANALSSPTDAELSKMIVGSWRLERQPLNSTARRYAYESFAADGSFKHLDSIQEATAPEQPVFEVSGTWKIEKGELIAKATASNASKVIGEAERGKIELVNQSSFVVRQHGNVSHFSRASFPARAIPGPAEVPKIYNIKEAAAVLRYVVVPEYSYEARRVKATGGGLFELRFDYETGRLKGIHIVQSTGSRVLDRDAVAALKEWKARPRTIRAMRIPIRFSLGR